MTRVKALLISTHNMFSLRNKTNELAQDKTYYRTCVTSKDSDQPVHSARMARVLVYPSLDSLAVIESTCDQQRL